MRARGALALLLAVGVANGSARAAEWVAAGDLIRVLAGVYRGPLVVERELRIRGEGWPVIDGGFRGTVVAVRAPDVRFQGFTVRNSGASLDEENAGITLDGASRAQVEGNRLQGVLFGVYVRKSPGALVRGIASGADDVGAPVVTSATSSSRRSRSSGTCEK